MKKKIWFQFFSLSYQFLSYFHSNSFSPWFSLVLLRGCRHQTIARTRHNIHKSIFFLNFESELNTWVEWATQFTINVPSFSPVIFFWKKRSRRKVAKKFHIDCFLFSFVSHCVKLHVRFDKRAQVETENEEGTSKPQKKWGEGLPGVGGEGERKSNKLILRSGLGLEISFFAWGFLYTRIHGRTIFTWWKPSAVDKNTSTEFFRYSKAVETQADDQAVI